MNATYEINQILREFGSHFSQPQSEGVEMRDTFCKPHESPIIFSCELEVGKSLDFNRIEFGELTIREVRVIAAALWEELRLQRAGSALQGQRPCHSACIVSRDGNNEGVRWT